MHIAYSIADQDFEKTASTGIYNFSVGLLPALAAREDVNCTVLGRPCQRDMIEQAGLTGRCRSYPGWGLPGRIAWDQAGVCRAARAVRADWLLLPKGFAPARGCPGVRLAVYIHDLIPLLTYEGSFSHEDTKASSADWPQKAQKRAKRRWAESLEHRSHNSPLTTHQLINHQLNPLRYRYLRDGIRAAFRHGDVIFTNTEFTRSELLRRANMEGLPVKPVIVAGYGFERPAAGQRRRQDRIVAMLRMDTHKRPDLTLAWMDRWQEQRKSRREVVFVGSHREEAPGPLPWNWRFVGRVSAGECRELMQASRVVVHFSEYEGFGMPPVEAVLNGACPVFSNVPATMEVMGETGFSFRNDEFGSFGEAMDQALECDGERIAEWAEELLERHSWEGVAGRIVEGMGILPQRSSGG